MANPKNKRNRPKVPSASRKRAIQACTPCRLRKSKCRFSSGYTCQSCIRNNQRCFLEPSNTDALEDDTFMDITNDALISDVLKSFKKIYPSVGLERRHIASLQRLISQDRQRSPLSGSDSVMRTQTGVTFSNDYFAVISRHLLSIDAKLVDCADNSGEFANERFHTLAAGVVSRAKADDILNEVCTIGDASHLFNDISLGESFNILPSIWSQFPSRTEADTLMNIFFSVGQANYYILHESWFRSRVSEIYDTKLSAEADCQFTGLLLLTFAVASQGADNQNTSANSIPGAIHFQNALRLLPQMLAEASLESIQCCLLMAIYLWPSRGARSSYIYIRLAMEMAISQGLHQLDVGAELPAAREIQNRVFWTAYIIERRISGDLGHRSLMPVSEVMCPPPQRCADLDGAEPCQIDRLIACRDLLLLSGQAMQLRGCGSNSADFRSACSRLQNWRKKLHYNLQRLDNWDLQANSHLLIDYHLYWLYLGCVDLIQIVENYLKNHRTGDEDDHNIGPSIALSTSCVDSAYKIVDMIELLRQKNQLTKLSHTDFCSCSFATTIILLDSIVHPSSEAGLKVATGMQALRFMASTNSRALESLKYTEGLLQEINEVLAHFHIRTAQGGSPDVGSPDENSLTSQFSPDAQHHLCVQLDASYDSDLNQDIMSDDNQSYTETGLCPQNTIFRNLDPSSGAWASEFPSFGEFGHY